MTPPLPTRAGPSTAARPGPDRLGLLGAGLIAAAVVVVYGNSLSGPFIFDDASSIVANPTIRRLWPPGAWLASTHSGVSVDGRPVLNLSLAINYAVGGTSVRGYHAVNLAIHLAAALALFGIVRRTLARIAAAAPADASGALRSTGLALAAALLWAVHPLQTEAVTYIIQRAESLMGLFYLLTLYCFIRSVEEPFESGPAPAVGVGRPPARRRAWAILAVLACVLGMGTKEVMVSAPLMVLLYDRTFVSGSFKAAWNRRRPLYAGLAATWIVLGYLVIAAGGNRQGSIGFGIGVSWWSHALTQFPAIVRYLRLSIWPDPLVFEYGPTWAESAAAVLPAILAVSFLLVVTGLAVWRRAPAGFLGAWFFSILAPTSLLPAPSQMIVEHRMYLPLAAVAVGFVVLLHSGLRAWSGLVFVAAAICLGLATMHRNGDYRTELSIWSDTIAKRPGNALAQEIYAQALDKAGRREEAIARHEAALRINPRLAVAEETLGDDFFQLGRNSEAISHYRAALRLKPDSIDAHDSLGRALARAAAFPAAIGEFEAALRIEPGFAEATRNLASAHYNLANALAAEGRPAEAVPHYQAALRLKPDDAAAHYNWGNALALLGRPAEAVPHYEAALRLRPAFADAHHNLGSALAELGRYSEAIVQFEEALHLDPDSADTRESLARVRAQASVHKN